MQIKLLYIVTGSLEEAKSLGRHLVALKLAACANILPHMSSIYRWKGKVVESEEVVLLIKTTKTHVKEIENQVKKKHSYECPCLLSFDVESGLSDYLKWVVSETS